MLASHNTFTYLKPTNRLYNLVSGLWKCQDKDIYEQYERGVRMFDIRLARKDDYWITCHGKANLKIDKKYKNIFETLDSICEFLDEEFNRCIYRIVLEKGDNYDKFIFRNEAFYAISRHRDSFWRAIIKDEEDWKYGTFNNNDEILKIYGFGNQNTWESPNNEYSTRVKCDSSKSIWSNIKFILKNCNIKRHAKRVNPEITNDMIISTDSLQMLDFV